MAVTAITEALKIVIIIGFALAGIVAIQTWVKNPAKKISYFRLFVQLLSQVVIFYLISFSLWLSLVLVFVLLLTVLVGRFFCGWICPFGFYMDLLSLLRQTVKKRYLALPESLNRGLHWLRYVLLGVLVVWPVFLINTQRLTSSSIIFLSGPLNPLRILLAPLVPVLAPWQTFPNTNLNFPYLDQIVYYSPQNYAVLCVLTFIGFSLVSSLLVRRFWCRFCPTGASVAVLNRFKGFRWLPLLHIEKTEEKCTKCGICQRVCTVQVTEVYKRRGGKVGTSMCMLCLRCVEMCPYEGCLKVKFAGKTLAQSRDWLNPDDEHPVES